MRGAMSMNLPLCEMMNLAPFFILPGRVTYVIVLWVQTSAS